MNEKALKKRRTQLERQRDAELGACRAKWRRRINSVDRLLRAAATAHDITPRAKPGRPCPVAVFAHAIAGKVNGERKEGVMELLQRTLDRNQGFFTAATLVEFINKTRPSSVSEREIRHLLWRLRRRGQIKLVDKGDSRKPHLYLKV